MNLLPAAATDAPREMAFVVAAHFRRQARNIIPPARQNLSHDWIDALLTHGGDKKTTGRKPKRPLQPNRLHGLSLGRQKYPIVKQSSARCQRFFRFSPRYFRMIVLL